MMVEKLPVIFRAEKHGTFKGEVTAVFPTVPGSDWPSMTCYAHVGQHSTCAPGWYQMTRPAKPNEYAPLLAELRSIYERPDDPDRVELDVRQRITPAMRDELRKAYGVRP